MNPKKTKAGMPLSFSASFYNRLVKMLAWAERAQNLDAAGQTKLRANATNVLVKNGSGVDLPLFSVLELDGRLGDDDNFIWMKTMTGVTPTSSTKPVAITQEPSKAGTVVECVIAGTTLAKVNITSTDHQYANVTPAALYLTSSAEKGDFRILEPVSAPGIQKVIVSYYSSPPPSMKLIKAPSGGIPGRAGNLLGFAECEIWDEDATYMIKDSGEVITVVNWTTSTVCKNGDRFGLAGWCNGRWYVIAEDCGDEGSTVGPLSSGGGFNPLSDPIDPSFGSVGTLGGFTEVKTLTTGGGPI